MAQRKRDYGTGCLLKEEGGWAIRWRELVIAPNGTRRRALRYRMLGPVSRREAQRTLASKVAAASNSKGPMRSLVTFRTLVSQWQDSVLPMFKYSTRKHRRFFAEKHLIPRFGEMAVSAITRQEIQAYVTHLSQAGYAPKSIDNIHDTLSAILRTAFEWGHLQDNPARGVHLPKLRTVRPKWVLTTQQAAALLKALEPQSRAMAGLAMLTGLRRGELFGLRWKDIDEDGASLSVREAVYDGVFDTPKTEAGVRRIPLSLAALGLIADWKTRARRSEPDALVFSTRSDTPVSPNRILRKRIFPACDALGLARATWLTFRRTYSSWSHDRGVPGKVVARLMGHAHVDTTLNVYTQVFDDSLRPAVETVGSELFRIVQSPGGSGARVH